MKGPTVVLILKSLKCRPTLASHNAFLILLALKYAFEGKNGGS